MELADIFEVNTRPGIGPRNTIGANTEALEQDQTGI